MRALASVQADTGISGVDHLRARQGRSEEILAARELARTPVWGTPQALAPGRP